MKNVIIFVTVLFLMCLCWCSDLLEDCAHEVSLAAGAAIDKLLAS